MSFLAKESGRPSNGAPTSLSAIWAANELEPGAKYSVSITGRLRGARLVDDDGAGLHHPAHFVQHDLDVGERVAVDGDDVGDMAGRDRAEARLHLQHFGRQDGGRL